MKTAFFHDKVNAVKMLSMRAGVGTLSEVRFYADGTVYAVPRGGEKNYKGYQKTNINGSLTIRIFNRQRTIFVV